jgi:hypothetical protein
VPELRTGWREVLDDWKVEAVLMPVSCAISQALLLDPEWHVAFSDSRAIFLIRRHGALKTAGSPRDPRFGKG